MPIAGSSLRNDCSGTLRDPGGVSNYYSNVNSTFTIDPLGNESVALNFIIFNTEAGVDSVTIYDGTGTTGAILGSFHGTNLPLGGAAVVAGSGAVTIAFSSNCCIAFSGFELNWSTIPDTLNPVFSVSITTPDYNRAVSFTSHTPLEGNHTWLFGDGTTSTLLNPVHYYKTSGPMQARLVVSNCNSTDTSQPTVINVKAPPSGQIASDTINLTVPCGGMDSSLFVLSNNGAGVFHYKMTLHQPFRNYHYRETFESNTLGNFVIQDASVIKAEIKTEKSPQGRKHLKVNSKKSGGINNGLKAQFTQSLPSAISYFVQNRPSNVDHGFVRFGSSAPPSYSELFRSHFKLGQMYLTYGTGQFVFPAVYGEWYKIELKNIDFVANQYDIYVDGIEVVHQARFIHLYIPYIDLIFIHHGTGQAAVVVDDIQLIGSGEKQNVTFFPDSGAVASAGQDSIWLVGDASDLLAGTYWLDFNISSNDTLINGKTIPVRFTVTGDPTVLLSKNCVNYGQAYTGYPLKDSVRLVNEGCDTANFTSILSTNPNITFSEDSLKLAPGDTSWLFVSLNATATGALADTLFLYSSDTTMQICLSANVDNPGQVFLDSLSTNIYYSGCADTLPFSIKLNNRGTGNLNWSTTKSFQVGFTDDFNGAAIDAELYDSWNGVSHNNNCGNINGARSLVFRGDGPRYIITKPLNTYMGGTISFELTHGYCERNEYGEGLNVEYSKDGGATWIRFDYLYPSYFPVFSYSRQLPLEAMDTSVQFRIEQNSFGTRYQDVWILDDLNIDLNIANNLMLAPQGGLLAAGDSVLLQGSLYVDTFLTGIHHIPVFIHSNDPDDSLYFFTINFHLQGAPKAIVPSCMVMDTTRAGASSTDSLMILNNGCGDLVISSITTATANYLVNHTPDTVAVGDTAYVGITFVASAIIGNTQDTLVIASNDTLIKTCLSGFSDGAPQASVAPDSIYVDLQSCNDSTTITLTISNNAGTDVLNYGVGGSTNSHRIRLTVLNRSSPSNLYGNTMSAVKEMDNLYIHETSVNTSALIKPILDTTDVLLLPYMSSYLALNGIIGDIENFVQNGGRVITLFTHASNRSILGNLVPITAIFSLQDSVTNNAPTHPVMAGLPSRFFYDSSVLEATMQGSSHQVLAYGTDSTRALVSLHSYGKGEALYLGDNFFKLKNENRGLLHNAIQYLAQRPLASYITIDSSMATTAIDDSNQVHLKFKNQGLPAGLYKTFIGVFTNDPLHPKIIVPVTMNVGGGALGELIMVDCIKMDSAYIGTSVTYDSLTIKNIGCDTMHINGAAGKSGQFIVSNFPTSIAPFDSVLMQITFSPSTIGNSTDTISVFGNFDTLNICISGKGLGVPLPQFGSDTIRVSAIRCDGAVTQNVTLQNTGAGDLDYDLLLGQVYNESSLKTFTASGDTTFHQFLNLPATADTLWFDIVINGDFSTVAKTYSMRIDNTPVSIAYDNNKPHGINDTISFYYAGPAINGWLMDGVINVELINSSAVQAGLSGSQDFHSVEISLGRAPDWALFSGSSNGLLAPSGSSSEAITFIPDSLSGGTYSTFLTVKSNSVQTPYLTIPVYFTVIDEPNVDVQDSCMQFPITLVGDTVFQSFWIFNKGCKSLTVSNIVGAGSYFLVAPTAGNVASNDSLLIDVGFIPTSIGTFSANLLVANSDSSVVLCLNGTSHSAPLASFTLSPQEPCYGEVQFTDGSVNNPLSYHWDFGDGDTSNLISPVHQYKSDGIYRVLLRVSNAAGVDTISQPVIISYLEASFGQSHDTLKINSQMNLYDSTGTAISWSWDFGDGGSAFSANPVHQYAAPGQYEIRLISGDSRSCADTAYSDVYVYDDVGIIENTINGVPFSLYPNPGQGSFYLSSAHLNWAAYTISIYDATGRKLKSFSPKGYGTVSFTLNGAAGLYRLSIFENADVKASMNFIME